MVGQDHLLGHRRHLVQPRFAELAYHVVLGNEAKVAVHLQVQVGGFQPDVAARQPAWFSASTKASRQARTSSTGRWQASGNCAHSARTASQISEWSWGR